MVRTLLIVVALVLAGCSGAPTGAALGSAPCDPCGPSPQAAMPPSDMPDGVAAGEAWCRVWVPAEYATVTEKVCVKPARERMVPIPAKYGTRPKLVCVKDAEMCERVRPATWTTKKVPRMVCPPREEIRRVCCPPSKELDPCEVQAGCFTKVQHPAVFRDEDCPVCVTPERRCVEYTPPEYKVVQERFILRPAGCQTLCDPPEYEQRCRQVCVRPGHWEWRRNTACEVPCAPTGAAMPMPAPAAAPMAAPQASLNVEIKDSAASGEEDGEFAVGDVVRYDLLISPNGSELKGIHVAFTLPADLEFVEGSGNGITIQGSGQSAKTSVFDVSTGKDVLMSVMARVVNAPESNLVQLTASVIDAEGNELVEKSENTVLKP